MLYPTCMDNHEPPRATLKNGDTPEILLIVAMVRSREASKQDGLKWTIMWHQFAQD